MSGRKYKWHIISHNQVSLNYNKGNQSNYVLDNFSKPELENIEKEINESLKIIETFCLEGVEKTMNRFN